MKRCLIRNCLRAVPQHAALFGSHSEHCRRTKQAPPSVERARPVPADLPQTLSHPHTASTAAPMTPHTHTLPTTGRLGTSHEHPHKHRRQTTVLTLSPAASPSAVAPTTARAPLHCHPRQPIIYSSSRPPRTIASEIIFGLGACTPPAPLTFGYGHTLQDSRQRPRLESDPWRNRRRKQRRRQRRRQSATCHNAGCTRRRRLR